MPCPYFFRIPPTDFLLEAFGGFHDSCIKEMRYIDNGYVNSDLGMGMTAGAGIRIIFQRQWDNPNVIEMEFINIRRLSVDVSDNHFADIFDASLFFKNDLIYWANDSNWNLEDAHEYPYSVWVSAKSLRWCILENALGNLPFYASPFGTDDDGGEDLCAVKSGSKPLT